MSLENAPGDAPLTDVVSRTPSLRRAYVLFMDIVGFSKLKTAQQVAAQTELNYIVQNTPEVTEALMDPTTFIARPTGDGMALLFFKDLLSPLRCAFQIHMHLKLEAAELKRKIGSDVKLRMGIHAGEVTVVDDMNGNADAAGDGIISAQRVMDLGDADHILLSSDIANVLKSIEPWAHYLTDFGEVRVKHKVIVHVYNLYGRLDGPFCGNPAKPKQIVEDAHNRNKEARAARPKLGDVLLPYRKPVLTMLILGGIGYGAYSYETKEKGLTKLWVKFQQTLSPPPPVTKPTPKSNGGKSNGGKSGGGKSNSGRTTVASSGDGGGGSRDDKIKVPSLRGMDIDEATSHAGGLTVEEVGERKEVRGFAEGKIYRQRPSSGRLAPGSIVKVWVSAGASATAETPPTENNEDGDQTGTGKEATGGTEGGTTSEGGASGGE